MILYLPQAYLIGTVNQFKFQIFHNGIIISLQIMSRWEAYQSKVKTKSTQTPDTSDISRLFPFHQYFSNAPQPIFKGRTYEEDMEIAEGCFRHIKKIFTQLEVSALY